MATHRHLMWLGSIVLAGALTGCRDVRDQFRPVVSDAPFVDDLGELRVITADELNTPGLDYTSIPDALHYGQLGAGENAGVYGGATFQFKGTGGNVCVVVDPEALFWNHEIKEQSDSPQYKYEDVYEDDGDLDLEVGLTAYYTGSPGVEVGDFDASYTDALGTEHTLAFNECVQIGLFGDAAHAGRGTIEYCDIDTSLREGVSYTALLKTFALPIDDSILNYGTMAFDGKCSDLPWTDDEGVQTTGPTECVIPNEVQYGDPDGEIPEEKAWFPEMETAFCAGKGKVNSYCSDHLDDDYPPCTQAD